MQPANPALIAAGVLIVLLAGLNVYQSLGGPDPQPAIPAAPAPPAPESAALTPQQITDRFIELEFPNIMENEWFGVPTLQSPSDVWTAQEIFWAVKPEVVVETGTWRGGSAALWAMILMHIEPDAKVISIDIADLVADEIRALPIVQERVEFLVGSSTDRNIVDEVRRRVEGKRALVILDSAHQRDHVLKELEAYWELVPVGSYIIVQDTAANGHPLLPDYGPGPWEAVEDFLAVNDHFEIDEDVHRMRFTLHPRGYLRRVR